MVAQIDKSYFALSPSKAMVRLISYGLFEGRPLTTRGRWINPLVLKLGKSIARRNSDRRITAPIFILGQGRSGTTILGLILSLHKSIGFLNEPKALWHTAYPCEDLIGNYTSTPAKYILDAQDATEDVVTRLHRLYSAFMLCTGSRRVLDKYPELIFRVPFVNQVFPDSRFLLVVRNGWDVCQSIETWSNKYGTETDNTRDDWWGRNDRKWNYIIEQLVANEHDLFRRANQLRHLPRHRCRAALEWLLTTRMIDRVQADYPHQTLLVKYERLTENPAKTLNEILSFCELDPDDRVSRYAHSKLLISPSKGPFALNDLIREPFMSMMKTFDYA